MAAQPLLSEQVIQVVVHPALRHALEAWLRHKGLELAEMPSDDLPTFVVTSRSEQPQENQLEAMREALATAEELLTGEVPETGNAVNVLRKALDA